MNQLELNNIAKLFVHTQSLEVAKKLDIVFSEDLGEKVKHVPGSAVHHIHNMALFYVLLRINSLYQTTESTEAASRQYLEFAETLKSRFLDIVESLKDFRPTGKKNEENNPKKE